MGTHGRVSLCESYLSNGWFSAGTIFFLKNSNAQVVPFAVGTAVCSVATDLGFSENFKARNQLNSVVMGVLF